MKIRAFHIYIIGFIITVSLGFHFYEYYGFIGFGALYGVLVGFIMAIFNVNPMNKSIYNRRKKEVD